MCGTESILFLATTGVQPLSFSFTLVLHHPPHFFLYKSNHPSTMQTVDMQQLKSGEVNLGVSTTINSRVGLSHILNVSYADFDHGGPI